MKKFFSGKRDSESRKLVLYLIFPIFIMLVVLLQTFNLTVINGKKYETQSENNRIVSRTIYPTRGLIYDTHDKLLVENIASSQLNLVPERSTDTSKKIKEIADLLNLEKSFLLDIFEKQIKKPRYPFQPITLAKSLDDEQIAVFSVSSEKFSRNHWLYHICHPGFPRSVAALPFGNGVPTVRYLFQRVFQFFQQAVFYIFLYY